MQVHEKVDDVRDFDDEGAPPPRVISKPKILRPFEMPTKLFEKIDRKRVGFLLKFHRKDLSRESYRNLVRYYQYVDKNGIKVCRYDFGETSGNYGRLFCSTSLQKLSGDVRAFITNNRYRDIDMKNANPTILLALCKKFNIDCPNLKEYCENRDHYLDSYSEELNIHRNDIKHGILHMLFGQSLSNLEKEFCRDLETFPLVSKIKKESKEITEKLVLVKEYDELITTLRKLKSKTYPKRGLLSYIIQTYEHKILMIMTNFFKQKKYEIGTYIFDGLLLETNENIDCLEELEDLIEKEIGFRVAIMDKPMKTSFVYRESTDEDVTENDIEENILQHGIPEYNINEIEFSRKRTYISYDQQKQLFEKTHFKISNPTLFCYEFIDEKGKLHIVETKSFKTTYEDVKFTIIGHDKEGKKFVGQPDFIDRWLVDPNKRCYDSFIFNPDPNYVTPPRFYNLFTGFEWTRDNCSENLENIQPYLDHLKKRVCKGNEKYYNYLIRWMAHLIQFPHIKTGIAVVLKSPPGAGKGISINPIKDIMGLKYFAQPADQNDILGNFNGILKGVLLLFLDELAWGGDKSAAGKLKKMVTETITTINKKGVPTYSIDNFMDVLIASNEEWVVPAIPGERRFFVLQMLEELCGISTPEKKQIIDDILKVKPEHLAHFLYNIDLSEFDVRKPPMTDALVEQQENSYSPIKKWWMDILMDGQITFNEFDEGGIPEVITRDIDSTDGFTKDVIYDLYEKSKFKDKYKNKRAFWTDFQKIATWQQSRPTINGKRQYVIYFSRLDVLVEAFGKAIGNPNFSIDF